MDIVPIKHALISVSDKLGLVDFARGLAAAGVELFASGGTQKHLEQAGLKVREISAYTGFPEMMDGRIKTLHPKVHGGILGRHDNAADQASMREHGIVPFELVVVNLYPFEAAIAKPNVTDAEAIEQIDIGGPTLVRGAAKNHAFVTVVTSAEQYAEVLEQITKQKGTTLEMRRRLAAEAFEMIARYDRAIADYFAGQRSEESASRRRSRCNCGGAKCCDTARIRTSAGAVCAAVGCGSQFGFRAAVAWQGIVVQQPAGLGCGAGDCPVAARRGGGGGETQQSVRCGQRRENYRKRCTMPWKAIPPAPSAASWE